MSYEIRRAGPGDVDAIAAAHVDSIRSIGPRYYDADVVSAWGAGLTGDLYASAMSRGEIFFIAIGRLGGGPDVLGFSSHRIDDGEHGTAVYVRGSAARQGVGSALYRRAEASARAAGAARIEIDASLAAVDFYRRHGFVEVGRGAHALPSGRTLACVFMRKALNAVPPR